MRFQSKYLFSVFCLVLMSFVFMSSGQEANAQDWCCNNNNAMGGTGQCVQSPGGAPTCGGANVFFEDGVNGIILAPLGPPPDFPQSGDLCPNMAQDRETCMCVDSQQQIVPCQDLPPPPTNPPPTDPPPTDPPPTDPPPTDPPPTNPPPTDPPPTEVPPATPTPTPIPIIGDGCCVEDPGSCRVVESSSSCPVPPYFEYVANVSTCDNVAACNVPPPPTEVPTMSQWGLIATAIMLGLFSLITVRRGFKIKNN